MACRLEEIPQPHDFVEYEILDQSIIVVRTDDMDVRAFQNACRHRGVKVVEGRGTCESGFTCPFHGWCYGLDGKNTFVPRATTFAEHNLQPDDIDLRPVRCEVWGGCAWINLDDGAPPLRQCLEPVATVLDAWKVESLRTEWWYAFRLPVNWKLAEEAFMEQYHVLETHPQLRIPGRYPPRDGCVRPACVRRVRAPLPAHDERRHGRHGARQRRAHRRGPARHRTAGRPGAGEVDVGPHAQRRGRRTGTATPAPTCPTSTSSTRSGMNEPMGYGFPHYFVLPMYSSASSYRFRPLGPEETLMEIWSLTRFPEGQEPAQARRRPSRGSATIHGPRRSRRRTSRTCRGSNAACTRGASSTCACPSSIEGHISNFHRTIDGFLAGAPLRATAPGAAASST